MKIHVDFFPHTSACVKKTKTCFSALFDQMNEFLAFWAFLLWPFTVIVHNFASTIRERKIVIQLLQYSNLQLNQFWAVLLLLWFLHFYFLRQISFCFLFLVKLQSSGISSIQAFQNKEENVYNILQLIYGCLITTRLSITSIVRKNQSKISKMERPVFRKSLLAGTEFSYLSFSFQEK